MRPSVIDEMSWAMAEVYGSVTDQILANLAKYFPYIKNGKEPKDLFEYQARMLAQMGQVNRETVDIIAQNLGGADAALRESLEAAILEALRTEEPKLRKAAEQGLIHGPGLLPPELNAGQTQAFRAYYAQSADKLNLVNTVMLESTQAAYASTLSDVVNRVQRTQSILNAGAGEVVTGVSSWNEAMYNAVQKMVTNGLTGFVDHGNHHWSPEAYVAMDIRTTMFNTSRAAIWERANQYGVDLYQVSSHNGARPLCYPWQGKVISRTGWTGQVTDLYGNTVIVHSEDEIESFRYGGGLFGVNCGHYPITFIPGVSDIKGEPQDPEENAKTYAESQQQRALERDLRKERLDLAVMKAQGASAEDIKTQKARVDAASEKIDKFCDETGRARRRNREYTPVSAKFPPKNSYNPAEFPTEQRDKIRDFMQGGGNKPIVQSNTFKQAEQYRATINKLQAEIDGMEKQYSELYSESIMNFGTEKGAEADRKLQELQTRNEAIYRQIDTTRDDMERFLASGDEDELARWFGPIKGEHDIWTDANNVNLITNDPLSSNNCGFCSLAYDARRRGIDCKAPLLRSVNEAQISQCWEGLQFGYASSYNPQQAMREISDVAKNWGAGSRGIVAVDWGTVQGHFFSFEVNDNGECQFIDAQTGSTHADFYFENARPGTVRYARTDDKELTVSAFINLTEGGKK